MKRSVISLLLVFLVACFSVTAAGEGGNPHSRLLMGSLSGDASWVMDGKCDAVNGDPQNGIPGLTSLGSMTGEVSHFGRTTYESSHCSTPDGQNLLLGEATLTAANGDEVWLSYTAELVSPFEIPGTLVYLVENVVVGGTGRFEGASGEILFLTFVTFEDLTAMSVPVDHEIFGSITY